MLAAVSPLIVILIYTSVVRFLQAVFLTSFYCDGVCEISFVASDSYPFFQFVGFEPKVIGVQAFFFDDFNVVFKRLETVGRIKYAAIS